VIFWVYYTGQQRPDVIERDDVHMVEGCAVFFDNVFVPDGIKVKNKIIIPVTEFDKIEERSAESVQKESGHRGQP
jgi:hypothetical protein